MRSIAGNAGSHYESQSQFDLSKLCVCAHQLDRCASLAFALRDPFLWLSVIYQEPAKRQSIIMSLSRTDRKTTVGELIERFARFRDSRDWRRYDTPRNLAGSICIEAAELLEHFQWKTDEQAAEMLRNPEELAEISNELADVIIYCLGFSDILTLDVSNAVQRKLETNAEKYPSTGKDLQ